MSTLRTYFLRLLDHGEDVTAAVCHDYHSPHPKAEWVEGEAIAVYGADWAEPGKTDLLLEKWKKEQPSINQLHRLAVQESHRDGKLATLDPVLVEAKEAREALIQAAITACEMERRAVDDDVADRWNNAIKRLSDYVAQGDDGPPLDSAPPTAKFR